MESGIVFNTPSRIHFVETGYRLNFHHFNSIALEIPHSLPIYQVTLFNGRKG